MRNLNLNKQDITLIVMGILTGIVLSLIEYKPNQKVKMDNDTIKHIYEAPINTSQYDYRIDSIEKALKLRIDSLNKLNNK